MINSYKLVADIWDKKERDAMLKVIKSNNFTMGNQVLEFEEKLKNVFKIKNAIVVNSGSSANLISISALRIKLFNEKKNQKNEIILPKIAWSTTLSPLFYNGFKPIFVDVGKDFNIDCKQIKKFVTKKTAAIFTVNLLGEPSDLISLKEICKNNKIHLIEDNCESMGATLNGKFCGTFGLAGTLSFFFSHHITTIEGGAILSNDNDFADICRSLRAHGWIRELSKKSKLLPKKINPLKKMFYFPLPGFNLRPTEFVGALGKVQLKKLFNFVKIRKKNLDYFKKKLELVDDILMQKTSEGNSSFSFGMYLKKKSHKNYKKLILFLKKNNIEARPIAGGNLEKQPMCKYFSNNKKNKRDYATEIDNYGFMIGNSPINLFKQIDYFINRLLFFFNKI
jgi:dTDP-4-amino-4,6-dideoxygalactose transaminase